jgi:DNA-binding response OmpR family regulator
MILIVDSEQIADNTIKHSFQDLGFESVEVVKSAEAARLFIKEHSQISMIVINGELDDGDGYKLCQDIRKAEVGRSTYIVIVVSSAENKTAIDKANRCGANDFVVKPYNGVAFKEKVSSFISSSVVVLVEDDPVVSMTVKNILSKYSIEVITIADGIEAHNLFKSISPVRLVLLDIDLPNMSGLQLIKAIRSKSQWKKTAVVMLTGSTDVADVKESLTSGANDYIAKPFKIDSFIGKLDKYFHHDS